VHTAQSAPCAQKIWDDSCLGKAQGRKPKLKQKAKKDFKPFQVLQGRLFFLVYNPGKTNKDIV
jgi:hypothetical protein